MHNLPRSTGQQNKKSERLTPYTSTPEDLERVWNVAFPVFTEIKHNLHLSFMQVLENHVRFSFAGIDNISPHSSRLVFQTPNQQNFPVMYKFEE
jgi:hypothetical protein